MLEAARTFQAAPTLSPQNCATSDDPFDPNTWAQEEQVYRIYGSNDTSIWAEVDADDYAYFSRWRWHWKTSRGGKCKYLRRNTNRYENGVRIADETIYLHVAIMKRTGIEPPTPEHIWEIGRASR